MTGMDAQARSAASGRHLVLYDGVCGLCSALVQFLLTRDRRGVLVFASLQSPAGRAAVARGGGDPDALTTFYVVEHYRGPAGHLLSRSEAALFLAGQLGWPWKLALGLRVLPVRLRDAAYDVMATHRYRLFGRREHCLIPRPEHKARFVEHTQEVL